MDIDYLVKSYLENYDLLIEQLAYLCNDESEKETLLILSAETKDKKWLRGVEFSKLLDDANFELFLESKVKLFSHKEESNKKLSEQLFGDELSLKKIFNNREDNVKFVLWSYLHSMVLMIELAQKKKNKNKIKRLSKVMEDYAPELEKCNKDVETTFAKDPKTMIKDMLGVDVNEQTNDMVADIVKSFESTLQGGGNANPLAGILEISKKISEKYQDKINQGDIQLDKLMEGIQKTIPGMDKVLKGDGKGGLGGLESMMGGMMGGSGGAGGMMSGLFGKGEEKKETVIIDENFSTSNVELGKIKESSNLNIGKLLNVADSMGVIPSFGEAKKEGDDSGMPQLSELFGMMNGIGKIKSQEEADALKAKVDTFMEKKLGLDMNKVSKDMEKMFNKKGKKEESKPSEDTNKEIDEVLKTDVLNEMD
jgi:hypothetical protein